MHFSNKLYINPSLKDKQRKIMWKLRTGSPQPMIYVIALAKNSDLIEIYHSGMLKQKYYRKKENSPYIVGLAAGYAQAIELVTEILTDVFHATNGYDVKAFFRSRNSK